MPIISQTRLSMTQSDNSPIYDIKCHLSIIAPSQYFFLRIKYHYHIYRTQNKISLCYVMLYYNICKNLIYAYCNETFDIILVICYIKYIYDRIIVMKIFDFASFYILLFIIYYYYEFLHSSF